MTQLLPKVIDKSLICRNNDVKMSASNLENRILYSKPSITDREVEYATDAARNGWGPRCYEYIHKFEVAFKAYLGTEHAYATSSCTGALHLGMAALGIGPGDEVILGDLNWIATAAPIVHLGAKPVFVDVLDDSWCIDPGEIEKAITSRTKAIVVVHIYGNLCDMDAILDIGRRHNLPVIEDAAEALGSTYKGRLAGSMGVFGAFSFHGTKSLTTGEGGMLVTSDPDLLHKVQTLGAHGREPGETAQFWSVVVGYKYRMANVDAAIGLAQIERVEELIERKRNIFKYYHSALSEMPGVRMNPEPAGIRNAYWMPTVVFEPASGVTRDRLLQALQATNADARVVFWPLSCMPPFGSGPGASRARQIAEFGINLPSYHDMTDAQQDRIIEGIRSAAIKAGEPARQRA